MNDIALVFDNETGQADVEISENDLLADDGLRTAVLLSLFCDRRAGEGDALFEGTDRRGWWADGIPVVAGDLWGSRLWLLDRSTNTAVTFAQAEGFALEALQWLVDDGIASAVRAAATQVDTNQWLLTIEIDRPGRDVAKFRFTNVWTAEETR